MFWQSVIDGIFALLDWRILVGVVAISFASFLTPLLTMLLFGGGESKARFGAGFAFMFFGGPLLQAVAVSAFILLLLPAILGSGGITPSALILPLIWPVLKAGLIAMVVVFALCFVPVLGGIITETPGVPIFLQGIFMLRPIAKDLYFAITEGERLPSSAFPSFLNSIGYVAIGLILCFVAFMVVGLISDQLKKHQDPIGHMMDQYRTEPSSNMKLVGTLIGPIFGVAPLLMYGQFVGRAMVAL